MTRCLSAVRTCIDLSLYITLMKPKVDALTALCGIFGSWKKSLFTNRPHVRTREGLVRRIWDATAYKGTTHRYHCLTVPLMNRCLDQVVYNSIVALVIALASWLNEICLPFYFLFRAFVAVAAQRGTIRKFSSLSMPVNMIILPIFTMRQHCRCRVRLNVVVE